MAYTLSQHHAALDAAHDRFLDACDRYERASERAGEKLGDELARIRRLNDHDRYTQMVELVSDLLNYDGGVDWLDGCIETLAGDTDEVPTALVMRWAGETEYLP